MRNITYVSSLFSDDFQVGKVYDRCKIFCAYNLPYSPATQQTQEQYTSADMDIDCKYSCTLSISNTFVRNRTKAVVHVHCEHLVIHLNVLVREHVNLHGLHWLYMYMYVYQSGHTSHVYCVRVLCGVNVPSWFMILHECFLGNELMSSCLSTEYECLLTHHSVRGSCSL